MRALTLYGTPTENLILWGAVGVFLSFFLLVLTAKLASGRDCLGRLNKAHFLFSLPYIAGTAIFLTMNRAFSLDIAAAFAAGVFIYFSLHYIYLQGLVGLAKKSVSVNILESIANSRTEAVTEASLLSLEEEKISLIREDRLQQMLILGMAVKSGDTFRITPRGRFLNGLGCAVLKAWNLRRP